MNGDRQETQNLKVFDCPHYRGTNTVTLKPQRSVWEGDREVLKRPGRDESTWVVMHLHMQAMLGISHIAILISTSKNVMPFLLLLLSSPQQNWRKGQNRFFLELREVGGEGGSRGQGEK
jgi:hypothetical protein